MAYNTPPGAIIRMSVDGVELSRRQINSVGQSMDQLANTARTAFGALAAAVGVGAGLSGLVQMADEYAKFTAQLRLASQSTREYADAYAAVKNIANASQQSLAATGVLYARIANGTRELGVAQSQVAKITEVVNMSLKVSGATATESASAQLQLSQAFASGTLRGEEFNAVNEAAPRLMLALADGMGMPVGALKKMAGEGLITSKIMAEVLPKALEKVREEAKQIQTIGGAFTVLKNNMLEFVGIQANASGAVSVLTGGIGLLADNLALLAGAMMTAVAAKLGGMLSSYVVATYNAIVASRALVAANAAVAASTLASAEALVIATTQRLAGFAVTTEAIVLARAEAVARLSGAQANILAAEAAMAAAAAAGMQSFALRTLRLATAELAVAEAVRVAMLAELALLGRHQAAISTQITATLASQTAAQTALNAANAGGAVTTGLVSRAVGLLGGPVMAIITLLGVAAMAWSHYSSKADEANKDAAESFEDAHKRIIAGLDKQIEKNENLLALKNKGMTTAQAEKNLPITSQIDAAQKKLDALNKPMGQFISGNGEDVFTARLTLMNQISELTGKMQKAEKTGAQVEKQTTAERVVAFNKEHATKQEQMNAELTAIEDLKGKTGEYDSMVKRIKDKYVDKSAAAAIKKEETAYTNLITTIGEKIAAGKLEMLGYDQLSESQKLTIKLDEAVKTGKSKVSAEHVAEARALIAVVAAQDLANASSKFYVDQAEARLAADGALVQSAQDETDRNVELARTFGMSKSAIEGLELARLREQLAQADSSKGYTAEIAKLEELIHQRERSTAALAQIEGMEASKKANEEKLEGQKKMWESIDQTARDTFVSIFDSGKSAFDRLKDTLKNGLLDLLYQMTVKKWIFQISAAVTGGGVAGTAQAAGTSMLGSAAASALTSLGTSMGVTAATSAIAAYGSGVAMSIGGGTSGAAMAASLATSGNLAAGAAAGVSTGASISAALAAIPGWGWAALAAIAVVKLFGGKGDKETTSKGLEGTVGGGAFTGNVFQNWKQDGGWFYSDKSGHDTSALDAATAKQLTQTYAGLQGGALAAANALGLSTVAIANYSEKISVDLSGKVEDAAKDAAAIAAMFDTVGNKMAAAVAPGIAMMAKEGEVAGVTLARLSGSITTANSWLSILRQRLFQVSLAGGDAASKLADAFGGLDQLAAASKSFYELYYTEGERAARSQEDMTAALAKVNLAMPDTMAGLRELAGTLDLNTDAGRTAYAMLLAVAPEFASVATAAATAATKMAEDMSKTLLAAYSGNGKLTPALDATMLKLTSMSSAIAIAGGTAGSISTIFLDAQSTLLNFNNAGSALRPTFTGAQLTALALANEIDDLKMSAAGTIIDIAGLGNALASVDTETFVLTMGLVFNNLATRIASTIDGISTERVALREAALQIINPTVMSMAAIQRGIAGINTMLPSNTALVAAQRQVGNADWTVANKNQGLSLMQDWYGRITAEMTRLVNQQASEGGWTTATYNAYMQQWRLKNMDNGGGTAGTMTSFTAGAQAELNAAKAVQTSALAAAALVQIAYTASLQNFAIDASKSVSKLSKLREETVKYYDAQKQLADLMSTGAATLRGTVADIRYGQMTDAQQFDSLQASYATAYSMALSTNGEALAGYGSTLNSALNPLLEKAKEVLSGSGYATFAATAIARAEAIAARLETLTPTNYAADSLLMLGQIDATLAALDASSKSAERIIADAVNAGSDKTASGLRAVIAALTGQAIPAFALGGNHAGGLRLVGENGPELEVTGPSRIFNAAQTRGMLSGGNGNSNAGNTARLEALVEQQNQELVAMRAELRAIATSNAKMARLADRVYVEGALVRTDADMPLTVAA